MRTVAKNFDILAINLSVPFIIILIQTKMFLDYMYIYLLDIQISVKTFGV